MLGRVPVLGVTVTPITMAGLHAAIGEAVWADARIVIANHNLHSVYLAHTDEAMRRFYRCADIVHIDGMPLVWLARRGDRRVTREHRVTYADWIHPLARTAARNGWRIYSVGGRPGVGPAAAARLREAYPALQIEAEHGFFDTGSPEASDAVLRRIEVFGTNVLLVGMGMPRQEQWILSNLARIHANAVLTAGACMDYVAGAAMVAPRWLGRVGLEWLFRLAQEPRRLCHRYLVEPFKLARILWAAPRREGGAAPRE